MNCNFQWNKETIKSLKDSFSSATIVSSPFLQEAQKKYMDDKKNLPKDMQGLTPAQEKAAELDELRAKYDIIAVTKSRDVINLTGKIGRKSVRFEYDPEESSTIIPEATVVALLASKVITPANFIDGVKPYTLPDGTKIKVSHLM
jgi:hypothetical protein